MSEKLRIALAELANQPVFVVTSEPTPTTRPGRRLLNGSWPLLDGNIYPPIRGRGPLGGYESYVRRSPPATE